MLRHRCWRSRMIAVSLILVSAILHAIVNILTKRADDKYAMRLLIGVFSAIAVAPILFFLPLPRGLALWCLLGTAFVHAFYELLLVKSYETSDFSAVYPIARGTGPLFTAIGAMLVLHEHPPPVQLFGIALICGGVIAIGISHRATEGIHKGISYALATGVTIGCYTVIDATGVRSVPVAFSYILWFFVVHGVMVLVTAPSIRGAAVIANARAMWRLGLLVALLSDVSYGAAMLAWRYGATATLAALRETSVLFGTALAMSFLGETMTPRRWIAAGIIVLGAILLQGT
jgi:drug/metabolite transporter (DMT)-like permease